MSMTIEKLAEIVNQQWNFGTPFRRTAKEWQAFCESTAQAIATAVLGPVTDEELRKAYAAWADAKEGAIPAAINAAFSHRLASLAQSKQPAADASKADETGDDEVERVAKAIYNEAAVNPVSVEGPYSKDPRHGASRSARWAARAAISAMSRGERWGVQMKKQGEAPQLCIFFGMTSTTDKRLAEQVCKSRHDTKQFMDAEYEFSVVRLTSTPQVQVPEEAVEAGARALASANRRTIPAGVMVMNAMEEPDWKPWKKHAESCLTAALPHLQRGVTK